MTESQAIALIITISLACLVVAITIYCNGMYEDEYEEEFDPWKAAEDKNNGK